MGLGLGLGLGLGPGRTAAAELRDARVGDGIAVGQVEHLVRGTGRGTDRVRVERTARGLG